MTTASTDPIDENDLRERISLFLRRNFPQIEAHGGSAAIESLDVENGSVTVRLSGACSGCGISPMTTQAVERRLVAELPQITNVETRVGFEAGTKRGFEADDVPF